MAPSGVQQKSRIHESDPFISGLCPQPVFCSLHRYQGVFGFDGLCGSASILQRAQGPYKATVVVDGLSRTEVPRFTRGLRSLRIAVHKVRGTKDESDALIRLADALAGFVRDYLAGEPYAHELYRTLHAERVLKELP